MTELIKIEEREGIQTVNARVLWEKLESKQDFSTWIKSRLEGFIEEADYLVHKFVDNPKGGRPTIDYYLTIDTAKHLAMLERNDIGRKIRQYFIDVEKQAKEMALKKPTRQEFIALAVIEAQKVIAELSDQVESMKPAVQFMADVTGSKDAIEMSQAAKIIDMGMGRNALFQFLQIKIFCEKIMNHTKNMSIQNGFV